MGSPRLERSLRQGHAVRLRRLLVAASLSVGCAPASGSHSTGSPAVASASPDRGSAASLVSRAHPAHPSVPERVDPELQQAMDDAAAYLARACGPDGRFVYRIRLRPGERAAPSYNVLRHAGAIYALAQYQTLWPRPEVAAAIGRATGHLWTYVRPVDDARHRDGEPPDGMMAVFSAKRDDMAKLGGAGLSLVAMAQLRTIAPGLVDAGRIDRLSSFVRWMQKPDGSFHSKYFRDRGPDDSWTSLYYPGEAALGLVLVGGDGNRRAALDALSYLARSRRTAARVPPDHWALIATGALLQGGVSEASKAELRHHARRIVDQMLDSAARPRPGSSDDELTAGSWGAGGRTTPTATRLEGLIAALGYLDEPIDDARAARTREVVQRGIAFLLRSRVRDGMHRGAVPRSITWSSDRPSSPRADEVRIDYVQHALSAWIGWARLGPHAEPPQRAKSPGKSSR